MKKWKWNCNPNQFSLAQMCSNSDGKTSGSGTMGVLTITVGLLTFIMGAVHDFALGGTGSIMTQSIIVISLGTGLLGYRKSKGSTLTKEAVAEQEEAKPIVHVEVEEDMSGGDEEMLKS